MENSSVIYLMAYLASIFGGWLVLAIGMHVLRASISSDRKLFKPLDFWLGATERSTATTLVIFAPTLLPAFAGGWVALKFAAKWQRSSEPNAGESSLIALVGSVWSLAIAIAAGVWANPDSLTAFSAMG